MLSETKHLVLSATCQHEVLRRLAQNDSCALTAAKCRTDAVYMGRATAGRPYLE